MKSNVGSFTDVFKGAEFLKFLFLNSVPKILNFSMLKVKTTLINAEGQNNTYKTIKDMLKVRNTSRHL